MSREIKFRVWDVDQYWSLRKALDNDLVGVQYDDSFELESFYDDVIIEQYTGLKDKNGVEIYEGDIINMWYAPRVTCKGVVEYDNGAFYFLTKEASPNKELLGSLTSCGNYIEVIGNIHEELKC